MCPRDQGRMIIRLKPRNERGASADEVIRRLQPKVGQVPGIRVYMQNPPTINVGGRMSKSQYQYTLQSGDIAGLYASADQLLDRMRDLPDLQDVTSDLQIANPKVSGRSIVTAPPRSASRRARSRRRSTIPSARGRSRPFSRRATSTGSSSSSSRSFSRT